MNLPQRKAIAAYAGIAALGFLTALAGQVTFASFTGQTESVSTLRAAPDWVAPTVNASVIAKATGGEPGYVHGTAGQFYVYATIVDSGNPASGVSSANADISALRTGATTVALTGGTYSLFGQTYTHRSALQTTNPSLANASYPYSLRVEDGSGNSRTASGYTVVVDNAAPTATDIQAVNGPGASGHPDPGDVVTYTFSEAADPHSILSGWTGSSTNVVVRMNNGAADANKNDKLVVYDAANTTQLRLGVVDLGRSNLVTSTVTFGASGSASTLVRVGNQIVLTLGTQSGNTATVMGNTGLVWSPLTAGAPTDRAGNPLTTTSVSESGAKDRNF